MNQSIRWSAARVCKEAFCKVRGRGLPWLLTASLLGACGSGDSGSGSSTTAATDNTTTLSSDLSGQLAVTAPKRSNVMELTISGIGTNNPQTEVNWVAPDGSVSNAASSAGPGNGSVVKSSASTQPLLGFLDVAGVATSTLDAGGIRYIATRIKVRNAPACGAPPVGGTCAPYLTQRQNVTFFAVSTTSTINQTAVSRFKRFDGTDANFALTTSLLPAHGLDPASVRVHPPQASLQVYNENELPPAEPTVTSVFPYGFVVRNVNNGSRILPASPANNQYDGEVTFGFSIPVQPLATDDPFKISLRFQTADDLNLRVTQSTQEQDFLGDVASTFRASSLGGSDLTVLGGRLAQTPIGNPICRVRTAGTAASPTAFLVNQIPATPLIRSAPMNLSFVERTSEVSVGFCENMTAPTASTFVVNGSQSGRRVAGGAYGGTLTGGGVTSQRNQLLWNINGEKPYFLGEEVSFTATAGNTNSGAASITSFVGSFRIRGSNPGSGTFDPLPNFAVGTNPNSLALGDVDGDGVLDMVIANQGSNNVSVKLGLGAGLFGAATNFSVGTAPTSVALGDVNGDGQIDIVTANFNANSASVLLNLGGGSFGAATNLATGILPATVNLGDLNADGRLDIVTSNALGNNASVLLNTGGGGFAAATNSAVGTQPFGLALGDFNADGVLDIATTSFNTHTVSVLLGSGAGAFGAATNFAVGLNPTSIVVGDVNGDGKLDILASSSGLTAVSVLLGTGSGTFGTVSNYFVANDIGVATGPVAIALGDVNGDGRLDVVTANSDANNVAVMFGTGTGAFTFAAFYPTSAASNGVALGDVNDNGRLDIVVANSSSNSVTVLLGR